MKRHCSFLAEKPRLYPILTEKITPTIVSKPSKQLPASSHELRAVRSEQRAMSHGQRAVRSEQGAMSHGQRAVSHGQRAGP
jgi:hypothetical protein